MILLHPLWLVLLIPLGLSLWLWRMPSRLLTALRAATLVLILLAMAGLSARLPDQAGTVVIVADRSRSMPPDVESKLTETIKLIHQSMPSDHRLAVVSVGAGAVVEQPPRATGFTGFTTDINRHGSNLAAGLHTAASLIPADAPGRILLLSDGRWTGRDPLSLAGDLAAQSISVDFRPLRRPVAGDLAIASIDAPSSVAAQEAFMIHAWVRAPSSQTIRLTLRAGNRTLASYERTVPPGLTRLTFRENARSPGTLAYRLVLNIPDGDPIPENNSARLLIGVRGARPILLVSSTLNTALADLLRRGGLDIVVRKPGDVRFTLPALSDYSAVILENVSANRIGTPGMRTLASWVRSTGAGLMMTGGRHSFGPGGYFRSPLAPLLPVSMELRREHRELALAIVVVMDRSGSMAVPVGGGRTKMDLANLAAAQVLDLLSAFDEFGAIAVDSQAHVVVPLSRVGNHKSAVRSKLLSIQSAGGGIFVYNGLVAAAQMLQDAHAGTRHIILLADAADAEQPGRYKQLLKKCRKANISVSVVALGTPTDPDADFLRDVARRGGGRIYFTTRASDLPRLFAQDTFIVARSSFLDQVTPVRTTAGLTALLGRQMEIPKPVGGYNLTYLREEANLSVVTVDKYSAPLVAAWRVGLGRALVYTGQADGKYTGPIANWSGVGELLSGLARWTAGEGDPLPSTMRLTQHVRSGVAIVELHLDPDESSTALSSAPRAVLLRAATGHEPIATDTRLHWVSPHKLALRVPLRGKQTTLITVRIPGYRPISLPPVTLPYSPEFAPVEAGEGVHTMRRLARLTGGKRRLDLASIWESLPQRPRYRSLAPWLLIAAVVIFLAEILERRTGLVSWPRRLTRTRPETGEAEKPARRRRFALRRRVSKARAPAQQQTAAPFAPAPDANDGEASGDSPEPSAPPTSPASAAAPESSSDLSDALRRARRAAHDRTGRDDHGEG